MTPAALATGTSATANQRNALTSPASGRLQIQPPLPRSATPQEEHVPRKGKVLHQDNADSEQQRSSMRGLTEMQQEEFWPQAPPSGGPGESVPQSLTGITPAAPAIDVAQHVAAGSPTSPAACDGPAGQGPGITLEDLRLNIAEMPSEASARLPPTSREAGPLGDDCMEADEQLGLSRTDGTAAREAAAGAPGSQQESHGLDDVSRMLHTEKTTQSLPEESPGLQAKLGESLLGGAAAQSLERPPQNPKQTNLLQPRKRKRKKQVAEQVDPLPAPKSWQDWIG